MMYSKFEKLGIRIEAFFGCSICKLAIKEGFLNNTTKRLVSEDKN